MKMFEALQTIRTKTGYIDAEIARLVGVSAPAVSRWGMETSKPTIRHLSGLREAFRSCLNDEGWSELFLEMRGRLIAESNYKPWVRHRYPLEYDGPVYTEVEPMSANWKLPHEFTLQWVNPSQHGRGVEITGKINFREHRRIALVYAKWNQYEGFPVYFRVNPPCYITFGQGMPKTKGILDLNRELWTPIQPDREGNEVTVLNLPFPRAFTERFPFKIGDVLYIIVGEQESDLPLKITMQDNSLVFDLSQLFPPV